MLLSDSLFAGAEDAVMHAVLWLKLVVEVAGAAMIGAGLVAGTRTWLGEIRKASQDVFGDARLRFARFLQMALELQPFHGRRADLGSDRQAGRDRGDSNGAELLPATGIARGAPGRVITFTMKYAFRAHAGAGRSTGLGSRPLELD